MTSSNHLGVALKNIKENSDQDAVHLMHTVKLIRNSIFQTKDSHFTGSFDEDSQKKSVPQILVSLIGMLLEGPGYCNDDNNHGARVPPQQNDQDYCGWIRVLAYAIVCVA